jgi:Tol biopolymer transport system component/tRNA A-37 threonylcarbamoyl transferase component Bud32
MALDAGTHVGPYEVLDAIGAGGMGEVYRARDSKLHRDVALKILPAPLAGDPDRLARFRREAQLLASLNHPHIAQIHGFEDSGQTHALVMELVQGPTLADVIAGRRAASSGRQALEWEEALHVARQIADALEAAHECGIVHRDLKPANVKLQFAEETADLKTCRVKVLDFGLAKAIDAPDAARNPWDSPTMTSPTVTGVGTLLGTATYMSPEQARGRAADRRADVWAFGVVLYEMLTGRPPFAGDDVSDTLANVLKRDPDWRALPADVPPRVTQVVRLCLEKRVSDRLADVQDVRLALGGAFDAPPSSPVSSAAYGRCGLGVLVGAVSGAVVAALIAGVLWWWRGPAAPAAAPISRLSIVPPPDRPLVIGGDPTRSLALSPDGSEIVYVASVPDSSQAGARQRQLVVRALASRTVRDIPGTTNATQPFFSPDGQWVGFFTSLGELEKVSLAGGNPITLATGINGSTWSFGVWMRDGTIVFSAASALLRVPAEGGAVSALAARDPGQPGPALISSPTQTASGRTILFSVRNGFAQGTSRIDAIRLDSGTRVQVLEDAGSPFVTSDGRHLLFARGGASLVAPFDEATLRVTGPAVPLVDDIQRAGPPELAIADTGTLAYVAGNHETDAIGLVSRDGAFRPLAIPRGDYGQPRVSPDGRTLAFTAVTAKRSEVHLFDIARGRLATLPASGAESALAWSPDSQSLAVTTETPTATGIALADLAGGVRLLLKGGGNLLRNASFSPDGTRLAYTLQQGSPLDIWMLTLGDPPSSAPFLNGAAAEHSPRFSPDGRWLAYVSNESGRAQVYIRRYPQGPRFVVSIDGGQGPVWRRDGRELFFEGVSNGLPKLMSVAVTPAGDAALRLAPPVPILDLRTADADGEVEQYEPSRSSTGAEYDVLPDGTRFVMLRRAESPREIVIVPRWMDTLASAGAR